MGTGKARRPRSEYWPVYEHSARRVLSDPQSQSQMSALCAGRGSFMTFASVKEFADIETAIQSGAPLGEITTRLADIACRAGPQSTCEAEEICRWALCVAQALRLEKEIHQSATLLVAADRCNARRGDLRCCPAHVLETELAESKAATMKAWGSRPFSLVAEWDISAVAVFDTGSKFHLPALSDDMIQWTEQVGDIADWTHIDRRRASERGMCHVAQSYSKWIDLIKSHSSDKDD